jgi:EmrB/QacA subfamily drug resistance transporter
MLKRNEAFQASPARSTGVGGRTLALIIASAMFMEQLDSTILATALPTMARSFRIEPVSLNVAMTSYLLSLAIFIPASGQLADRLGARTIFRSAIAIFTLGSALCGFATNLPMLIAFRMLQGLGGAMMIPVGRLLLFRSIPKSELIGANSWLLVPTMLGPVLGPPVGGLIVSYAPWNWIFWVNIPVGILGFTLVTLLVGDVREEDPKPFDFRGLAFSGAALSLVLLGLEIAITHVWSEAAAIGAIIAGIFCGCLYVLHARRHSHAVLDLRLLDKITFRTSVFSGTLFRLGFGAMPFLLPLLFQLGFGLSAVRSGTITFVSAAGSMIMKGLTVRVLRRWGYRNVMIWNGGICAVLVATCGIFRPSWPLLAIYVVLFVGGLFRSLQFNAFGSIAYAEVDHREMSAATTFTMTMQQISATLGIAVAAAILNTTTLLFGRSEPTLSDFTVAFFAVALISLLPLPLSMALSENAGAELTGHRRNFVAKGEPGRREGSNLPPSLAAASTAALPRGEYTEPRAKVSRCRG